MITKKNFIEMIDLAEKFDAEITRWSDFGIDVFDLPISEIPWRMFTSGLIVVLILKVKIGSIGICGNVKAL